MPKISLATQSTKNGGCLAYLGQIPLYVQEQNE